ncbi:MAG TPA: DedA family protein [Nocardioidaceae bacterium]|jgi:membrane protein DedA with SNARE-associated domain
MTVLGIDVSSLLHHYGLLVVFAGVALESMGVPVPGESVLVLGTAVLAHGGHTGFWPLLGVAVTAAVVGDNAGYLLGRFGGWPLLRRVGPWLRFEQGSMKIARYLFARHGAKLVFAGRFVAFLRTTSAFLAGVNHMPWPRFLVSNAAGGVLWASVWTSLAFLFGTQVDNLPSGAGWAIGAAALVGVVAAAVVVRRRLRGLRTAAERAYPGQL